jgi:hypothetical protein
VIASKVTLIFLAANGGRLALATAPTTSAGVCDPITFRIGRKAKKPLIDHDLGASFTRRVEEFLGVRIPRRPVRVTPKG